MEQFGVLAGGEGHAAQASSVSFTRRCFRLGAFAGGGDQRGLGARPAVLAPGGEANPPQLLGQRTLARQKGGRRDAGRPESARRQGGCLSEAGASLRGEAHVWRLFPPANGWPGQGGPCETCSPVPGMA